MSDPADGLPAWLQFNWDTPVTIAEVRLIFDTGLHRHLTLSHHDGYTSRMHWGTAQPETVRDYTVEARDGNTWTSLIEVHNNDQRLRRHTLPTPCRTTSLRIHITQTNGLDHARIMEVFVH